MKIYIGSDHAGFELKGKLISFLQTKGYVVEDVGAYTYDAEDDYPDFVVPVARAISRVGSQTNDTEEVRGIIIGGSGQGEAIIANRLKGVRAVVFNGQYKRNDGEEIPNEIILSRTHNDSNILSLGARFISYDDAEQAVLLWLTTAFSKEERHIRRIKKIDSLTE